MIKHKLLTLAAGILLFAAAPAFADGGWRHEHRGHGYAHGHWKFKHHRPHRVVVVPAPRVYYAPPPVVYAPPPPVVVYPRPMYVTPRPTIVYRQPGFSLAVGF
jgi:hypothetical protein